MKKMKRFFLASTMCILPFAASAQPLPPPPMPAAESFSWTGFYVGGTVGGIGVNSSSAFNDTRSGYYYGNLNGSDTNITAGLTAGYNYQVSSIVWGIEADYTFAKISKSPMSVTTYGYSLIGTNQLNGLGTVRPRLGYAGIDRTLFYVTGGLAYASLKGSTNFYEPAVSGCTASFSQTKTGWTFGGGVEYALTNHISAKVEYLYADLGNVSAVSPHRCTTTFKNTDTLVHGGLNYKF